MCSLSSGYVTQPHELHSIWIIPNSIFRILTFPQVLRYLEFDWGNSTLIHDLSTEASITFLIFCILWCFDIWSLADLRETVPPRANSSQEIVNYLPVSMPFMCEPTNSRFTLQSVSYQAPAARDTMPLPYISWPEEPGGLQTMGSQRVGHYLVTDNTYTHVCPKSSQGQVLDN